MQNISNQDGRMKFLEVTNEGINLELYTKSSTSSVPVAGGGRKTLVHQDISLQTQKNVTCPDAACSTSFIGNGVKMSFTIEKGDTAAANVLIERAYSILEKMRTDYGADNGLPPPVFATFPVGP